MNAAICRDMLALRPAQVLHARTCTGTERQLAHLLAACHLIFSVGETCDNMHLALDMLPPLRPAGAGAGAGGKPGGLAAVWGMPSSDSTSSLASATGGSTRGSVVATRRQ